MSLVHKCDLCKKLVLTESKLWDSNKDYQYDVKKPIKINNQVVQVSFQITLACGDHLEVCNKCANIIIRKYSK